MLLAATMMTEMTVTRTGPETTTDPWISTQSVSETVEVRLSVLTIKESLLRPRSSLFITCCS